MFGWFNTRKKLQQIETELHTLKNQALHSGSWNDFFAAPCAQTVTADSAKKLSAVGACLQLIANGIAAMPCATYQRDDTGNRKAIRHDYWWLLNESPTPIFTAHTYWQWCLENMLLRGDAYSLLRRDKMGAVYAIEPLNHDSVIVKKEGRELVYLVNDGLSKKGFSQYDILHFTGFGFNGLNGQSAIAHWAKNAIASGLAADEFSSEFFTNGATPSVVVTYPQGVSPSKEQQDILREQFEQRYVGKGNRHRPALLVNGGDIKPIGITPQDSQLLDTRRFNVVDVCRAFLVSPDLIGENTTSAWGTGLEQRMIAHVKHAIDPHAVKIEQELNRKLFPRSLRLFVEFNREGLLRGDSKSEAEYFSKALGGPGAQGWMTINEVRRIKNLPADPSELSNSVAKSGSQPAQPPAP